MDAKHLLFQNPTQPAYDPGSRNGSWSAAPPAGSSTAAAWSRSGPTRDGFSFDNEGPRHTVRLEPFRIADRLVTCGEWADFIADGGYRRAEFWLSDGWATVNAEGWNAPLYWDVDQRTHGSVFTLGGRPTSIPASRSATSATTRPTPTPAGPGPRLPTEFEWEAATRRHPRPPPVDAGPIHPSADSRRRRPDERLLRRMAVDRQRLQRLSPASESPTAPSASTTASSWSTNTSCEAARASPPTATPRPTYRNFFPPAARWPFTSVRLAADA